MWKNKLVWGGIDGRKFVLTVILVLLLPFNILKAQPSLPFNVGERLIYSVSFNFIRGGESCLEVAGIDTIDKRPVYHIKSRTESGAFFDRIFKVRDYMESWVDIEGIYSRKFSKSIREGRYRKQYSVLFDYDNLRAVSPYDTVSIDGMIHDGLSLFYYVRTIDFSLGDIIDLNYFDNDLQRPFKIKVEKIEKVRVPAGVIECFVLTPFAEKGSLFKNKNLVTIHLSTDEKRLPVMISNEARFGSMVLKLESVELPN